jgi:hypothetical protein
VSSAVNPLADAIAEARVFLAQVVEANALSVRELAVFLGVERGVVTRFMATGAARKDGVARILGGLPAVRAKLRQPSPADGAFRDGVLYAIEEYALLIARLARGARAPVDGTSDETSAAPTPRPKPPAPAPARGRSRRTAGGGA